MLNEIKSIMVLKMIFKNLKRRIELKILKYSKKMKDKLNIHLKNYQDFQLIKELNQKFNLKIKDIDIELWDIQDKNLENEIFKYFNKIEFYELREINLNENKISNLNDLEKAKLKKLETLSLRKNEISDINVLEKVNLKNLKQLYLDHNNISDITILKK